MSIYYRDPEAILAFGEMSDTAELWQRNALSSAEAATDYDTNWRNAPSAAALEIAMLVSEFDEHISAERRAQLVNMGAGLLGTTKQIMPDGDGQ